MHKQKKSGDNISKSIHRYFLNDHILSYLYSEHSGCITITMSHNFSQICHLSSYAREVPGDSPMAMPLKSSSFFPYEDKYLNVFDQDMHSLDVGQSVCLSVGAELLFPWFVSLAQWKSAAH